MRESDSAKKSIQVINFSGKDREGTITSPTTPLSSSSSISLLSSRCLDTYMMTSSYHYRKRIER
eukprot:scaffold7225_cov86-Skeletonema_dohrnii-CCMP3373.AAC.2